MINYNNLIYLVTNIFRVFCISLFLDLFFSKENLKYSKWVQIFVLSLYYIINCNIYLLFKKPIITIIFNILLFIIITIPYKISFERRMSTISALFMLGVVCEGVVGRTFMWFVTDFEKVEVGTYILSNFLLYLIILILRKKFIEKKEVFLSGSNWFCITIIPLVSSIMDIIIIFYGFDQFINVMLISSLFIVNMAFFYIYSKVIKEYEVGLKNNALIQQNKAYQQQLFVIETTEKNISRIQHDYINHLIALKEIIKNNKSEELKEYFSILEEKLSVKNSFVTTGNETLDGILNYKIQTIKELGADIKLNIHIPTKLNIETFDLVVVMGNLLDNSIRALKNQDKGIFSLELNYNKGILFLNIKNSYIGYINRKNNIFITTKLNSDGLHGIGLDNVKIIVEKYFGEIDIKTENNIFDVEIIMYI